MAAVAPPDPPAPPPAARSERATIAFVAFLAVIMAFGVEAVLPAFGDIDEEFGFADRGLSVSLLVTALLVGMALGQFLWGPLSDRVGRRPALFAGIGLYALGAVGTAVAPSLPSLLAARVVWGLGAAAPNGLRLAVARDLFDGDRMARIVTFATAVFLIGPVVMPVFGTALLALGPWQVIPLTGVALAAVGALGAAWFGETLPPHRRAARRRGSTRAAIATIARTRASVGGIAVATLFGATFFVYLGSAQPIIDRTYGLGDRFIWFFAGSGIAMAVGLLVNARAVRVVGAARAARLAAVAYLAVTAVALVPTVAAGGRPSIWVWYAWVCATNSIGMVVSANASALALDPVGRVAGVASSVLAFCQLGIGSLLAAVIDSRLEGTVAPMLVGAAVYGGAGHLLLRWSTAARSMGSTPSTELPVP